MADERENLKHDSVGAWAKRLYFAARSVMDSVLRPYGLGSTQWYVLYQLANRRTNDAARSGAHAPDREGHAERDRGRHWCARGWSIKRRTPRTNVSGCFASPVRARSFGKSCPILPTSSWQLHLT